MKIILLGLGNIGSKVLSQLVQWSIRNNQFMTINAYENNTKPVFDAIAEHGHNTHLPVRVSATCIPWDTLKLTKVEHDGVNRDTYVINAMPHFTSIEAARWAVDNNCHYFDFTEDVRSRAEIKAMEAEAISKGLLLAPGQGLAPGMINILGAHMINGAIEDGLTDLTVKLRVGALSEFVDNPYKYVFTWSPDGVANEYVSKDRAIRDGQVVETAGMDDLEHLMLNGVQYEAFNTSGGMGTLIDDFANNPCVVNLDYKSLRMPGHRDVVKQMYTGRRDDFLTLLQRNIPFAPQNDYVIVYASVIGKDKNGRLVQRSDYEKFPGAYIGSDYMSAIQHTTSGGLVSVVELHRTGSIKQTGFISHNEIPYANFYTCSVMKKIVDSCNAAK